MTEPCGHLPLMEYDKQQRRELLMMGESVDCPDCGTRFKPQRDDFLGVIYLVKQEVA